MDLASALQASYAEGMGCRLRNDPEEVGVVHFLRRDGRGQYVGWMASAASKNKLRPWEQAGNPARLSDLIGPYELCALPPHVEPDFRPVREGAPRRIADLLG